MEENEKNEEIFAISDKNVLNELSVERRKIVVYVERYCYLPSL